MNETIVKLKIACKCGLVFIVGGALLFELNGSPTIQAAKAHEKTRNHQMSVEELTISN